MFRPSVNVLGTEYTIIVRRYDEDAAFESESISGYCEWHTKRIVVCDMATYKGWEDESREVIETEQQATLRHEIVHAFLNESGLCDNAFSSPKAWAKNEEMVDWFALQGPKIYRAWEEAGAV